MNVLLNEEESTLVYIIVGEQRKQHNVSVHKSQSYCVTCGGDFSRCKVQAWQLTRFFRHLGSISSAIFKAHAENIDDFLKITVTLSINLNLNRAVESGL